MLDDKDAQTLPELDREVFAQVWGRVAPAGDSPVEPLSAGKAPEREPLGELIEDCLAAAALYRELARRRCRSQGELAGLARRKVSHAKGLSAAWFLRSGVRYWPRPDPPVREGLFPALRRRFYAEGALARRLGGLAGATQDAALEALYRRLAGETGELGGIIGDILAREM